MYLDDITREQLISIYRGRYPEIPSGYLDKHRILEQLATQDKEQLLAWLEAVLIAVDSFQLETLFGDFAREHFVRPLSPGQVLEAIHRFRQDSLAGKYYAPFEMNSKNYNYVPPQTEAWFDELSTWLGRACELAEDGEKEAALEGLSILIELIETMHDKEIVFAHDASEWMIISKYDYRAVYEQLLKGG
ncbi:MAG: hypothetical protein H6573_00015 [Lewinellaceae bacterium]|nr:hypothetical protein [Lewinellaceae bacterium]MCB9345880.1 hypothetical protein [Lewinellaceae bacterium]